MRERPGFNPWLRKIPWRRQWPPSPVLLPRKFHGWRSLVGYSPWSRKESDMIEWLHLLSLKTHDQVRNPVIFYLQQRNWRWHRPQLPHMLKADTFTKLWFWKIHSTPECSVSARCPTSLRTHLIVFRGHTQSFCSRRWFWLGVASLLQQ